MVGSLLDKMWSRDLLINIHEHTFAIGPVQNGTLNTRGLPMSLQNDQMKCSLNVTLKYLKSWKFWTFREHSEVTFLQLLLFCYLGRSRSMVNIIKRLNIIWTQYFLAIIWILFELILLCFWNAACLVQLESWPQRFRSRFNYSVYPITFPSDNAREWKRLFKPCASQRLFLPVSNRHAQNRQLTATRFS